MGFYDVPPAVKEVHPGSEGQVYRSLVGRTATGVGATSGHGGAVGGNHYAGSDLVEGQRGRRWLDRRPHRRGTGRQRRDRGPHPQEVRAAGAGGSRPPQAAHRPAIPQARWGAGSATGSPGLQPAARGPSPLDDETPGRQTGRVGSGRKHRPRHGLPGAKKTRSSGG
jgi:hypothetical protein